MESENLIPLEHLCTHYQVELSFIQALTEFGLIEITTKEETHYLHNEQVNQLEKWIRMHYDLEINFEGLDAISHLLKRISRLQKELQLTRNRLSRYEE